MGAINQTSNVLFYILSLVLLAILHVPVAWVHLKDAIDEMRVLRNLETKPKPKQQARAFTLADTRPQRVQRRKGRLLGSYIHRLALPIREPALFWKECLKDGTTWSLTISWLGFFVLGIAGVSLLCRLLLVFFSREDFEVVHVTASTFAYTSYFVGLAAYFLVVIFQTTVSVAGERERNTLEFLLLLPVERREIIFCKWLGPLWKNWPILAISYLGVLLGLGARAFSPQTALLMLLIPWPALLMCSLLGLLLSVICRRTLYANIVMAGFLLTVCVAHMLGDRYLEGLVPAYGWLIFEARRNELANLPVTAGVPLVLIEQGSFLLVAGISGSMAYYRFHRTDYQGKM